MAVPPAGSPRARVDPKRLEIRPVSTEDRSLLAGFSCGDVDLDDFLKSDALELEDRGVVRTYLALYDDNLAGYESLLADAIRLETSERRKLRLSSGSHPV